MSNPLNYFERASIIKAALTGCQIPLERFAILPFPIEEPTELHEFLPPEIPVLTTTYDDWNLLKIKTLEMAGYTVVNLWTRTKKEVAGHEIRRMIQEGDPAWRAQVPDTVVQLLEKYNVARRLQTLAPVLDST